MGQYDNYSNRQKIAKTQKKLNKLKMKKKPDLYAIDILEKRLEIEKMFESCQIFGREDFWKSEYNPNANIMFSDDNEVILFGDKLIHYADLSSYAFIKNTITQMHTTTKKTGTVSRAIVGGALFGGIGAVVGAASAGSKSVTTNYDVVNGFYLQVFTVNDEGYQIYVPGAGMFSDKIPKKWLELETKLQTIIESKNQCLLSE